MIRSFQKRPHRLLALLSLFVLSPLAQAQITASNVRPIQRAGTKLVDIDYDVTGTSSPVTVTLQISADGGSTWTVPAITLTGAIGSNVTPSSNLRITWNAGSDWSQQLSSQTKFRISVTEAAIVPAGFALIPSGSFTMGDVADHNQDGDAPAHTVTVSPFYIAKYLVTKADWDTVRIWAVSNGYTDLAAGFGKASSHPVQTVSWYEMIKYCNARSQMEGLMPVYYTNDAQTTVYKTGNLDLANAQVNWTANGYRLPTEAEWEKAARGGLSGKRFPWGDTISHSQANFYNTGSQSYQTGTTGYHPTYDTGAMPYTSPVGSFAANGYGLYDMAGNVSQWCWDWSEVYDTASPTDPHGQNSGTHRVGRGGSWETEDGGSVGSRDFSGGIPSEAYWHFGFRVVRSSGLSSASVDSINNAAMDTRDAVSLASQPLSATVNQGESASFSVTVWGGGPYSYQWKKNGASLSGATEATLALNNVKPSDAASYTVVVTGLGSVTSNAAILTTVAELQASLIIDKNGAPGGGSDLLQVKFPTQNGKSYTVESSIDLIHWQSIETIVGDGGVKSHGESRGSQAQQFFRVHQN
jgi:formylglycine-generating enzyme required for sulfatase activity